MTVKAEAIERVVIDSSVYLLIQYKMKMMKIEMTLQITIVK